MCTGRPVEGCALRRLVFYGGADHWDLLPAQLPVARAMRLIADGVVDREGVDGLAARLGYSVRQVERQLRAELGGGPLALARAERAQTARVLIETSTLPMTQIALAAGFASIRAFNETVQEVFALSPSGPWRRSRCGPWVTPDAFLATDLGIRLAARTLGLPATPAALTRHAATWRPWRAYATQYLWATGDHAINRLPPPSQAAMPGTSAGAG